ncbi:type IX secretion system membrane protein PorP/SprF [Phaeodactylibacter luteus]|uniref:Type IX secretion system membrane protein PorP/SprF n=1 Tax=Phaeodactylibacter luteus TaxID=1564516 RepID=A0A5C6S545_9BACT|nr:type IX secretion system membrane protein PorP/SprF [Phaeodactylibacter luteus]TXB68931.1 type IX secretion system membrane protein PorP/SprF [Phaeodactylibacter luteus]
MHKQTLALLLLLWPSAILFGQDPFSLHFFGNQSVFNPALTGHRGALSADFKVKSQWASARVANFRSARINVEESLPCSILDYGLQLGFDEEGDGRFQTLDGALKFAGTLPFVGPNSVHNIRVGAALGWSQKRIDFSRLVFSDQLDAKYGNIFGTSFTPPNGGESRVFFTPSLGLAYKALLNAGARQATSLAAGVSLHNAYSLGEDIFGNEESVLGFGARIPARFSAFVEAEFIPYASRRSFFSIRPLLLMERQGEDLWRPGGRLSYVEAGARFSLNRALGLGIFYHFNGRPAADGFHTNWFTFTAEAGTVFGSSSNQRVDLGFAYSNNFTGLRNAVGALYEFTLSFHLLSSPGCRIMGRPGGGPGQQMPCPAMRASSRQKLFENIWY